MTAKPKCNIEVYDSDGDLIVGFSRDGEHYDGPPSVKHFMVTSTRGGVYNVYQNNDEISSKAFKASFVKQNWHNLRNPGLAPIPITGVSKFSDEEYSILFRYWWILTGGAQSADYYHDVKFRVKDPVFGNNVIPFTDLTRV